MKNIEEKANKFLFLFLFLSLELIFFNANAGQDGLVINGICKTKGCPLESQQKEYRLGFGDFYIVEDDKQVSSICPSCKNEVALSSYSFKNCLYSVGKECGNGHYDYTINDEKVYSNQNSWYNLKCSVRKIEDGLNVLGTCSNLECSSLGKGAIVSKRDGFFKLVEKEEIVSVDCPTCKKGKLNIEKYFFKNCLYSLTNHKSQLANKKGDFFDKQGRYITLNSSVVSKKNLCVALNFLGECNNHAGLNEVSARPHEHLPDGGDKKTSIRKEISGIPNMGNSCYINVLTALLSYYPLFNSEDFNNSSLKKSESVNFSIKWLKKLELLKANTTREVARSFARFAGYIPGEQDDPIILIGKMYIPEKNMVTFQNVSQKNYDGDLHKNERVLLNYYIKRKALSQAPYIALDMENDEGASLQDKLKSFLSVHKNEQENKEFTFLLESRLYSEKGLETLPKNILIQLKRYKTEYSYGENFKIISTKLKDYVIPNDEIFLDFKNGNLNREGNKTTQAKYQLVGIVMHLGEETNKGHYIARIKHSDEMWYIHNDEKVMDEDSYFSIFDQYSKDDLINGNGYLFMYKLVK